MGTHNFTPLAAVNIEMDIIDSRYKRWIEVIRLLNRITGMPETRWPRKVLMWDVVTDTSVWVKEATLILFHAGIEFDGLLQTKFDLDDIEIKFLQQNRTS